jgi:hypothetical protein
MLDPSTDGDWLPMLWSTCTAFWPRILDSLLPPVAALLSATALWVAARARSISRDVQSTSSDHETLFSRLLGRPTRSESQQVARDRRRSSTRGTTST